MNTALELLKSLWNDEGLRTLMRPDQVKRIELLLKEPCSHVWQKVASSMAESKYQCTKCSEEDWH